MDTVRQQIMLTLTNRKAVYSGESTEPQHGGRREVSEHVEHLQREGFMQITYSQMHEANKRNSSKCDIVIATQLLNELNDLDMEIKKLRERRACVARALQSLIPHR